MLTMETSLGMVYFLFSSDLLYAPGRKVSQCLRSTLCSLAGVKSQAIRVGRESNDGALGEVEDVSRNGLFEARVSGESQFSKGAGRGVWMGNPLDPTEKANHLHEQTGRSRR